MLAPVSFPYPVAPLILSHHERWDGSGYPDGLAGDDIPVAARLMALADVFDALICTRVYKQAIPLEQARAIIQEGSGLHFDPDVALAFLNDFALFEGIARRFADEHRATTVEHRG
ncbi:MAG: HD domain-containing protein [Syntrophobacteraceae bacterium]|nr:HD domain-containing protein [Syntrophobacteraceae bacterium]